MSLGIGAWNLFGYWYLEFGYFLIGYWNLTRCTRLFHEISVSHSCHRWKLFNQG